MFHDNDQSRYCCAGILNIFGYQLGIYIGKLSLRTHFLPRIDIPLLSPQSAIFGFLIDDINENCLIINHLLLIFKFYIYKERENGNLLFPVLMKRITKVKSIEENSCGNDICKFTKFNKNGKKLKICYNNNYPNIT